MISLLDWLFGPAAKPPQADPNKQEEQPPMNLTPLRGALDALDTAKADLALRESSLSTSLSTQVSARSDLDSAQASLDAATAAVESAEAAVDAAATAVAAAKDQVLESAKALVAADAATDQVGQ